MRRRLLILTVAAIGLLALAASPGLWTNYDASTGASSLTYSGSVRTFDIDLGDELDGSTCCLGHGRRMSWCSVANVTSNTAYPPVGVQFVGPLNRRSEFVPLFPGDQYVTATNSADFDLGSITGIRLVRGSTDAADLVIACSAAR